MGTGRRLIIAALSALALGAVPAAPAGADDHDSVPPKIEITVGGIEGLLGPHSEALAYFSTPGGPPEGSGGTYTRDDKFSVVCRLDGKARVRCPVHFAPTYTEIAIPLRTNPRSKHRFGVYEGFVPIPPHLSSGSHTLTVIATDEDGTSADPPSAAITMDRTPPSAPELVVKPPARTWDHKPLFEFAAHDDVRLVRSDEDSFSGALRRVQPPGALYKGNGFGNSILSIWFPTCPTLLECSTKAQAGYMAEEHWYSYAEPEWLLPGLYKLRLRARDAVGNKSARTTYRFRILRGGQR